MSTKVESPFMSHEEFLFAQPDPHLAMHKARLKWDAAGAPATSGLDPIRLEELAAALAHVTGLDEESALRDADLVMDLFGFHDRIIDNILAREDRQLFYVLEEEGLLTTDREETTLWDGREWRTHYWSFRKNVIRHLAQEAQKPARRRRETSDVDLYHALPESLWRSRTL